MHTQRAHRLRHLLTYVYTPLFLVLAVLFGVWASGGPPSPWALAGLAILFAVLALLALAVHSALHHRHRDHGGPRH
ncbi:hypothetical protein [Streptomyces sp. NPDC047525]|uniref:hypothetical protein n=1 Tax=Streptomyces sp. NPDC047525 TaxID=3155264 RepID=UPI003409CC1C